MMSTVHAGELIALALTWVVFSWQMLGWKLVDIQGALAGFSALLCGLWGFVAKTFLRFGRFSGKKPVAIGEVSDMIDIIRLGLSAGLSFDASLGLYCKHRQGELALALKQALMSWQVGICGREEALLAVAARLEIRALESFAVSVGQALTLGAPLADTLASQSRECRLAHRAYIERQIERAPVKLIIPTGTLILPALLLSILGPLLAGGGMI